MKQRGISELDVRHVLEFSALPKNHLMEERKQLGDSKESIHKSYLC